MIVHLPGIIVIGVNKQVSIEQFFYPIDSPDLRLNGDILIIGPITVNFSVKAPFKVKMCDKLIRFPKSLVRSYHQANIFAACPGLDAILDDLQHRNIRLTTHYAVTVLGAQQLDCMFRLYHRHIHRR